MSSVHEVKQGECLSSIAKQYGFRDWKVIYDDPNNKDFKKARPDPNVIAPGDMIFIPDKKDATKKVSISTEQKHKFKVTLPKTLLRIVVKDDEEKPIAGKPYALVLGKETRKGATKGDGSVEEKVDVGVTKGELTIWLDKADEGDHLFWNIAIGHLDPVDEVAGVQARLNNLGFFCGQPDGRVGRHTIAALKGFQQAAGLKTTGKPDDDTKKKLVETHGKT